MKRHRTIPPAGRRTNISSGTRWEPVVGYSRAVRVGRLVWVSGTTATDESGEIVGKGDVYAQAARALKNVADALERAGCGMEDVVRTRIYVTDASHWEQAGRAHGEVFGTIRPATSLIAVKGFVSPDMLIEIEAEAVAPDEGTEEAGHGR